MRRSVASRLTPLTAEDRDAASRYLAQRPFENVALQWLIERDAGRVDHAGSEGRLGDPILVWRSPRTGAIAGVAAFGAHVMLAADEPEAIAAFADAARRRRAARLVVGRQAVVARFWEHARSWHRPPTQIRTAQPLYALIRAELRGSRQDAPDVRRARRDEARLVAEHAAAMIHGELGYDPRSFRADYVDVMSRSISVGAWWIWRIDGVLRFMCARGPHTAQTAQLQGVWSPPAARGQGYATRALAAIADHLLDEHPSLSLYVNDFNHRAIALYERLGFRRVGTLSTLIF